MIVLNVAELVTNIRSVARMTAVSTLILGLSSTVVLAEGEFASKERSQAALGHYARARALLIDALAEFEQARKLARPDLLVDSEEWRLSLVSRTEELNRLLDPKPRITRSGVRFRANSRLVGRDKERVPSIPDGAKASSTYGEMEFQNLTKSPEKTTSLTDTVKKQATAPEQNAAEAFPPEAPRNDVLSNEGNAVSPTEPIVNEPTANAIQSEAVEPNAPAKIEQENANAEPGKIETPISKLKPATPKVLPVEPVPAPAQEQPAEKVVETPAAKNSKPATAATATPEGEDLRQIQDTGDPDINRAVEEAIQERLKKLEGAGAQKSNEG